MVDLSDEHRDLLLSLYLDGELEPEQAQAVAEKIRSDENWQREYALLRSSETRVTRIVEDNWHDENFTAAIRDRLRAAPPPTPQPIAPRRRPWLFWTMSLGLLVGMTAFLLVRRHGPPPAGPPSAPWASVLEGAFRLDGRLLQDRHDLRDGDGIVAESEIVALRWADGSRLWLRKGAAVRYNAHGGPAFSAGRALLKTAPDGPGLWPCGLSRDGAERETVELRDGTFDIEALDGGLRIRILSGTATNAAGTHAGALQMLTTEGAAGFFDPRECLACWGDSGTWSMEIGTEWPSAWPQLGGSAARTGLTPVSGPGTLKFARDLSFEDGRETDRILPAIARSGCEIYLVRQENEERADLYCYLDVSSVRRWASISQLPGQATVHPALGPGGLVYFGTNGKLLRACNYSGTAWEADLGSALSSITVLPDGQIVCGTFQRLVAFGETGKERWSYQGLADFQPPVAFFPHGALLAVSRTGKAACLSLDGKELAGRGIDFSRHAGPFGCPVIRQDGSVWLTAASGELLKHDPLPATAASGAESCLLLTAPPLADGTCAVGHEIVLASGARVEAPGNEAVIALAGDGAGRLFAATQNAVHLYSCSANGRTPPVLMESAPIKQGRVIPAGLAIAPGTLIVTTTGGVVVLAEQP